MTPQEIDRIESAIRHIQTSTDIDPWAAISAICNACGKIDCDKMDKCEKLQLPPANCSEFPNNSDTISRQAALDAIMGQPPEPHYPAWYAEQIEKLPSVQPEIIRCKDCKHWRFDHTCREHSLVSPMMANEFCSRAERREG